MKIRKVVLVIAVVTAVGFANMPFAGATHDITCAVVLGPVDAGDACMYKHTNFNNSSTDKRCFTTAEQMNNYKDFPWWNCTTNVPIGTDNMNDDTSSLINGNATRCVGWYEHQYGDGGKRVVLRPANDGPTVATDADLTKSPGVLNDAISSHRKVTCPTTA